MNGKKKGLLFVMLPVALSLALAGCFRTTTMCRPTTPRAARHRHARRDRPCGRHDDARIDPDARVDHVARQQFDWATQANTIESRINMFSEIQEAAS